MNYLYPQELITQEVIDRKKNLSSIGVSESLLRHGLKMIHERLKKDKRRYLDYGMYWWVVKSLLRGIGVDYGFDDDPVLREKFSYQTPVESIVAAELFRDDYLALFALGNRDYDLNDDDGGVKTVIIDTDMDN